ncbi:MAG: mitochondrial 37S ribosomal protein nam9 [Caeruleum heppii]|nr:MAG: mitochondrial 37S ribosomal protein nam9 [Caeruleum heppii]
MARRYFNLRRPKLRQSMHKYNLFNLSRYQVPRVTVKTLFQQKWLAKSTSRAYHGEQLREKQWERMFRPRGNAVVPMDHAYLARYDGSEQAAGRGSGLDVERKGDKQDVPRTPYMQMTYAPLERRLDTAIFRALFASSARQARQFVIHGNVKVNGRKMTHAGYLLNPGDMFQVDPDLVMYALGATKNAQERRETRLAWRALKAGKPLPSPRLQVSKPSAPAEEDDSLLTNSASTTEETKGTEGTEEAETTSSPPTSEEVSNPTPTKPEPADQKVHLQDILSHARAILSDPHAALSAKRKQDLREFQRSVRTAMSRGSRTTTETTTGLADELSSLISKISLSSPSPSKPSSTESTTTTTTPAIPATDTKLLTDALTAALENPHDPLKPYATPWRPRDYMSAFAFIPRYLEVNQNVCSAVYLRHPVARPGVSEVPSPFGGEIMGLAWSWYLRRR